MSYPAYPNQPGRPPVELGEPLPYHRLMRTPAFVWWKPVFGSLIILTGWIVATLVAITPVLAFHPDALENAGWDMLLATNLSLAVLIPLSLVVGRRLHGQPAGLISSVRPGIRWRPLALFAVAAVVVEVVMFGITMLMPVELAGETAGKAADAGAIIIVVLLTSTFQAAGEEYFFRGYLMQAFGSMMRSPVVPIVLTALIFTAFHGVWPWQSLSLFFDRFAFGLLAGWLVVRTGGLEASIAVHALNNIITFVFAALTDSLADSLGITDAPWLLVSLDIAKFAVFGAVALWITRRFHLQNTARLPIPQLPPHGYYGGPPGQLLV
jgi:membrane protease YdiL (CAAX protease family)